MSPSDSGLRSHVTLGLCTILHALTHAFGQALVPLYLLIVADFKLSGVRAASLIVTIYGFVYCVASYGAGILADRFNRKVLLGVALIGNSLALAAMGLTRQYEMLIVLAILAGLFGTIFHPAANALIPAHYPKSPGMAIGLLGIASISLLSIFLQKAYGYTLARTGLIVGSTMLLSVIANPLAVYITPGKRRLQALPVVLVLGGLSISMVPMLPIAWVFPVMCVFQAFQFGSYAISDAAMLERVSPAVRGRVVGLFLTLAGTFASLSPWAMGFWIDMLGPRAAEPVAYLPIFVTLMGMMFFAALSAPLFHKLSDSRETVEASLTAMSAESMP